MGVTAAPPTGLQVVFERAVPFRQADDGILGLVAEGRASQIRVNDYAGGIDDRAQGGEGSCKHAVRDARPPLSCRGRRLSAVDGSARRVEYSPGCLGDRAAAVRRSECGDLRHRQELVDCRQLSILRNFAQPLLAVRAIVRSVGTSFFHGSVFTPQSLAQSRIVTVLSRCQTTQELA